MISHLDLFRSLPDHEHGNGGTRTVRLLPFYSRQRSRDLLSSFLAGSSRSRSRSTSKPLSLEATRKRHLGTSPDSSQYNPDLWVDEYYFLNQPGQADIQLDLFYDYQNNIKSYPKWQQWLRDHHPPLLVLWGRYDTSFTVAGGEAYRKDDPRAEVHILDAGHFALDLKSKEIIQLVGDFMNNGPSSEQRTQ
jgi:pimeloyl-ACP methyl ester carboxylesterase